MVIIRLARSGAKKNPYYFITVADERRPRDGSFIERLGFFNPSARGQEERLRVDLDKVNEWVSKGAQLSDRVQTLVKEANLSPEDLQAKMDAKKAKSDAKKAAVEARLAKEAEEKAAEEVAEAKGTAYPATIDTLRKIVKDKQHQTVMFDRGQALVDLFTASAMVQVYDALKPATKKKFEDMIKSKEGFMKSQAFAMKMIG